MGKYSKFETLCFLLILIIKAGTLDQEKCLQEEISCGRGGPEIRFPFWVKKANHCGSGYPPGFGLSCTSENQVLLDSALPAKLLVKSIDYANRVIRLYAADGCISRQLEHLNLSAASPFRYAPDGTAFNFTLFRCPMPSSRDLESYLINCLSGLDYQVYAINNEYSLAPQPLQNCKKVATPFAPLPYSAIYENTPYAIAMNWSQPDCRKCEEPGHRCKLKNSISGTIPEIECYEPKHQTKTGAAARLKKTGYVLGPLLFVLIGITVCKVYKVTKVEKEYLARIKTFLDDYRAQKPTRYSYADIKRITNQFKEKVGQGGYGTVFKGKLSNDITVAVKILNSTTGESEEFINEVGTIGRIHHVNVVRLVGFCADGCRRALLYDFLPNESLNKFIFSGPIKKALGWKKLKDIALGAARGIEYLHQGCEQRILHFDIKPHNILLDRNLNPKISDFGLAKLCSKGQSAVSLTAARGTIGYIAPEVVSRNFGNVSHKSDVYSFGMLLVNMVEGGKDTGVVAENSSQGYFPDWIYGRLERGEVVGTGIDTAADANIAKQLTIVGLWCIQWYPVNRPSMKGVVKMLEGEGEVLTMPPNPFGATNPTAQRGRNFSMELSVISESD